MVSLMVMMWGMSLFATVGTELVGYGTLLLGIGSVMAIVFSYVKTREANLEKRDQLHGLKEALDEHSKQLVAHVTASRAQTVRYIDRKVAALEEANRVLSENQDVMLSMIVELDNKVTKTANSKTVVSIETKG